MQYIDSEELLKELKKWLGDSIVMIGKARREGDAETAGMANAMMATYSECISIAKEKQNQSITQHDLVLKISNMTKCKECMFFIRCPFADDDYIDGMCAKHGGTFSEDDGCTVGRRDT